MMASSFSTSSEDFTEEALAEDSDDSFEKFRFPPITWLIDPIDALTEPAGFSL